MSDYRQRKRKCGNCQYWRSQGEMHMGRCEMSTRNNGLMAGPTLRTLPYGVFVGEERLGPLPLQTSEYFHCCLWQRQEAAS